MLRNFEISLGDAPLFIFWPRSTNLYLLTDFLVCSGRQAEIPKYIHIEIKIFAEQETHCGEFHTEISTFCSLKSQNFRCATKQRHDNSLERKILKIVQSHVEISKFRRAATKKTWCELLLVSKVLLLVKLKMG